MRRGKLNNISIKLVVLIAFFTLTSFVFDQLVIQTENKIRDVDFEYERNFNEYLRTKSVLFNVNDLVYRTRVKQENFIDRAEILEKANARASQIVKDASSKAEAEAEKILTSASITVENETNKAKEELRQKMSEIIIETTQKILDSEISKEKHEEILKKAAEEL